MSNTLLDDYSNDKDLALAYLTGTLTSYEDDSLSSIGSYGFSDNKYAITDLKLTRDFSIGGYSFFNSKIENFDLSHCIELDVSSFYSSKGPSEINLNNAKITSIPNSCFSRASNVEKIVLLYVELVEESAFDTVYNLTYLDLGSKIKNLKANSNSSVFNRCTNLKNIIIRNENAVVNVDGRIFSEDTTYTGKIYVPDTLVDAYKENEVWSEYSSNMAGLSTLQEEN